jgi:hypothetical protein
MRFIASRILGNLLAHCAQETQHLAGFLPELYEAFGND